MNDINLNGDDELNALFDELDGLETGEQAGAPPPPESATDFFGPYQLVQPLGSGGVAQVWRTRHIHPNYGSRTLALKILHAQHGEDQRIVDLFRREAYVLSMLKHPNVVETFEAGVHDEKFFIAMEDVDGKDLEYLVARCKKRNQAIPTFLIVHIIAEVLKALQYAHGLQDGEAKSLHLIHRDINPANVFISFRGEVKLGDFGVASITASLNKKNELAGKPGYFAPEQLYQKDVDQRADIFAVGVMLFELLSGQRLFVGKDMNDTLLINRKAKVPKLSKLNPNIDPGLEEIVNTALQKKPAYRYESAAAMLEALEPYVLEAAVNQIAIRSFIRKAFRAEYLTSLQLRRGLEGEELPSLAGRNVLLICGDDRASKALKSLMGKYGAVGHSFPTATDEVFNQEYDLALVDGNDFQALQSYMPYRASKKLPSVVFADSLADRTIERVVVLKPDEFIFKPFTEEGFLRTLQAVMMNPNEPDNVVDLGERRERERAQSVRRLMVLDLDANRAESTLDSLEALGTKACAVYDYEGILTELRRHTPDGLIVQGVDPKAADDISTTLRRAAGVLDMPTLMVNSSVDKPMPQPGRLLVMVPPNLQAGEYLSLFNKFWLDGLMRRCFERYPVSLAAEVRFAGRMMEAETVNLSRGGAMVRSTQQMPPLNSDIGLIIRLNEKISVDCTCRVARVDLPKEGQEATFIGIAFKQLTAQQERAVLELIEHLEGSAPLASAG